MVKSARLSAKSVEKMSQQTLALINKLGTKKLNTAQSNTALDTIQENKKKLREAEKQQVKGAGAALNSIDKLLDLTISRLRNSTKKADAATDSQHAAGLQKNTPPAPTPSKPAQKIPTFAELEARIERLTGKKKLTQEEVVQRLKKDALKVALQDNTPEHTPPKTTKKMEAHTPQARQPSSTQITPKPAQSAKPVEIPQSTKNEESSNVTHLKQKLAEANRESAKLGEKPDKASKKSTDQADQNAQLKIGYKQLQAELAELRERMKQAAPTTQNQTPAQQQQPTGHPQPTAGEMAAAKPVSYQKLQAELDAIDTQISAKKPSSRQQPTINERPMPTVNDKKATTQTPDAIQAKGSRTNQPLPQKQSIPKSAAAGVSQDLSQKLQASLPSYLQGVKIHTYQQQPTTQFKVKMSDLTDSKTTDPSKDVLKDLQTAQNKTKKQAQNEKLSYDSSSNDDTKKPTL